MKCLLLPLFAYNWNFFYPIFKRLMPLNTYRYAACGGMNTLLNVSVFSLHNIKEYKTIKNNDIMNTSDTNNNTNNNTNDNTSNNTSTINNL